MRCQCVSFAHRQRSRPRLTAQPQLQGKAALAVAKRSYQDWLAWKDSPAVQALGAQAPLNLLWASTSTKNPAYPELQYVEPLMGPHTINTLPDNTLMALMERGTVRSTLGAEYADVVAQWEALAAAGIELDEIADELQHAGLGLFGTAYQNMLQSLVMPATAPAASDTPA